MRTQVFDIETIPAPESAYEALAELYELKRVKGQAVPATVDEYIASSGLMGEFGRIVCLAYALDDEQTEVLWGDETEILTEFWRLAKDVKRFVGHNVFDFDFPFVYKRSRILGVKPTQQLSFARYRNLPIYDTMREWSLWGRDSVSLHTLARAFDLPTSKDAMDGSEVAGYFAAGKIEEICTYCKKDVDLTRQVYRKMTFGEAYF